MSSIIISALHYQATDGKILFDGLDLAIGRGLTGLVGANGSGKSTLLHLIADDLRPTSGSIMASGAVGMLRQDVQTADETVADLFAITPMLASFLCRASDAARQVSALSGGEAMHLALCAVFPAKPTRTILL